MQLKAKTKLTESSCKQSHPESQTYVGLLVQTHIIFCCIISTRWITIYIWASPIESVHKTFWNKENTSLRTSARSYAHLNKPSSPHCGVLFGRPLSRSLSCSVTQSNCLADFLLYSQSFTKVSMGKLLLSIVTVTLVTHWKSFKRLVWCISHLFTLDSSPREIGHMWLPLIVVSI